MRIELRKVKSLLFIHLFFSLCVRCFFILPFAFLLELLHIAFHESRTGRLFPLIEIERHRPSLLFFGCAIVNTPISLPAGHGILDFWLAISDSMGVWPDPPEDEVSFGGLRSNVGRKEGSIPHHLGLLKENIINLPT